jgi:hypothetical protein
MTEREKYKTRNIILLGDQQKELACAAIQNAPAGVEVVIREPVKVRKLDQNALMWVGPLKDIAEQAYVEGRTFSDVVWHEHFKELYLPEEFDPELTKEGYRKWDYTPSGRKVLAGSTTQLTIKGFAQYLEQVYAFGASLGVMFKQAGVV